MKSTCGNCGNDSEGDICPVCQPNSKFKTAAVEPLDKALNGERCVYCNSTNTAWTEITGCEVAFHCNRCQEGFYIEFCFLSEAKQAALSAAERGEGL